MSFPIVLAVGRSGDTYSNLYTGSSLVDAQNALSTAITGATATIGWVFENPVPVTTLRSVPVGTMAESVPPQVFYAGVLDIESAPGLQRLADGKTTLFDDETYVDLLPLDESGQELQAAVEKMTADEKRERHEFALKQTKERDALVRADQQAIEDQYAEIRGAKPRDVTKDYTESPFVQKQRAEEAKRADKAFSGASEHPSTKPKHADTPTSSVFALSNASAG